jgi:nickel/cobalt transporter (NiCoT) family protein
VLTCGLALRPGADGAHIAAINTSIRKPMGQGQRPIGAGLFFALGHSEGSAIAAVVIALTDRAQPGGRDHVAQPRLGDGILALLLFVMAVRNLVILRALEGPFRRV